jgi:hypothetical protein
MQSLPGTPAGSIGTNDDLAEEQNLVAAAVFDYRTYSYRENLLSEFERLVAEGRQFDGLIIDVMQVGYTLPMEAFIKYGALAKRLLKQNGVLLFIRGDGAVTLTRDDPAGGLTFNVFDNPFGIFARYPMLADYVCATVSGIDRRKLRGGGSTLANHILFTSIPVLTEEGSKIKDLFEIAPPKNWILQLVDDYSSVEAITRSLEKEYHVPTDESLRMLQELESEKLIYPIFSRLQFLSSCYHNRKPFRLGRYMVVAGIITSAQLEELLEIQQEEGWGRNQRTFLGLIAVRKGYLNTRELEVLLNDQYLYGGYHRMAGDPDTQNAKTVNLETVRDSMIGSLGAIDTAGLLQSLATAKKTGLLTVENRNKCMSVAFADGRPTHALMDKLKGYIAIVEFLVTWKEGIFVFRDRSESAELDSQCMLSQSMERVMLDAALYQDQMNSILSELTGRGATIIERVWNFKQQWQKASQEPLQFMDGAKLDQNDHAVILELSSWIDGLSTLDEVIGSCDVCPAYLTVRYVKLLLDLQLVKVQQVSLFRPLGVFQSIVRELQTVLGPQDNREILKESLHYVHGNSPAAKRFNVDHEGCLSVDLNEVKTSGTPVSSVLVELRRWMEAYLAYARRQIDPAVVNEVMVRVVHKARAY